MAAVPRLAVHLTLQSSSIEFLYLWLDVEQFANMDGVQEDFRRFAQVRNSSLLLVWLSEAISSGPR